MADSTDSFTSAAAILIGYKKMPVSLYQTQPILDKSLWLAQHIPGRVEICTNERGARRTCQSK